MDEEQVLPIIVDKWAPNKDIERVRNVFAINSLNRYLNLELAYRTNFRDQNWVYNVLYNSGLYPVFVVFNVPPDNVTIIKNLIDYNYAPTRPNMIILLDSVLPSSSTYTIVEGVGEVTITIVDPNFPTAFNTINALKDFGGTAELTDRITDENTNLIEYADADTVINPQDFYILNLYVPCGVKLNVVITST